MITTTPYQKVLESFQTASAPLLHGVAARKLALVASKLTGTSSPSGVYKLTPLHVAVMTGDMNTVKALLALGCNPNAKDLKGWTPLHHAALISSEMMKLLISNNASSTLINVQGGTPEALYRMANSPTIPLRHKVYALDDNDEPREITRSKFKDLTGATYIEEPYIPAAVQFTNWSDLHYTPSPVDEYEKSLMIKLNRYRKNPPKLALTTAMPKDDNGVPQPIGRSVVALEDIPAGTIVTPYYGKYTYADDFTCGNHKLGTMDGENFRNLGPQAADSFPNTFAESIRSADGAERSFLTSFEKIEKGTAITWDYGSHKCKWGGEKKGLSTIEILKLSHRELRPRALKQAVREINIATPLDSIDYRIASIVCYILNTPSTLHELILSGQISLEEVENAVRCDWTQSTRLVNSRPHFQLPAIKLILQPEYAHVRSCILEVVKRGNVQLCATLLHNICNAPKYFIGPENPESTKKFAKLLDQGEIEKAVKLYLNLNLKL